MAFDTDENRFEPALDMRAGFFRRGAEDTRRDPGNREDAADAPGFADGLDLHDRHDLAIGVLPATGAPGNCRMVPIARRPGRDSS
jgi:hypothetical protein